jgi:hypothetical protein
MNRRNIRPWSGRQHGETWRAIERIGSHQAGDAKPIRARKREAPFAQYAPSCRGFLLRHKSPELAQSGAVRRSIIHDAIEANLT